MKCGCGYEGPGNVVDEKKSDARSFWECPKCKSSKRIMHITGIDIVMRAMLEEHTRVAFTQGSIFKSADGRKGMNYSVELMFHNSNKENRYDYGWMSIEDYRELKKWALKQASYVFDKYCEEFAMTDCTICQKEIDFKCRFIAKRLVGECNGKVNETLSNVPSANRYADLYKYYYRKYEEV